MKMCWSDLVQLVPGRMAVGLLVLAILISSILLWSGPAYMGLGSLTPSLWRVAVLLAMIGLVLWRPGLIHPVARRLIVMLSGILFLVIAWDAIRILNHTTMTLALPMADDMLDRWDKALGLNWRAYFDAVASTPSLRDIMAWSYTSLTYLSVLAFLLLCLGPDYRRSIFFLETFTATAVVCTLVGALFPARGSVDRYVGASSDLSAFTLKPGLFFLAPLERLRTGLPVELVPGHLPGLVTFPSFHTAAGVLIVAATWRSWLFVPATAYAALVIAATPVYGGHYFVDLIAGGLVATIIALCVARHARYRDMFSQARVI